MYWYSWSSFHYCKKGTTFLSASTLTMVAKHVALYGILALGMTFVIITGGIDLSVGSVVGLVGMLAGGMIRGRYHTEICRCYSLLQRTGYRNPQCWLLVVPSVQSMVLL